MSKFIYLNANKNAFFFIYFSFLCEITKFFNETEEF